MNLLDRIGYDSGGYTVQEILSSFCKKILEIIELVNKNEEVCEEVHTIIENIRNEVVPGLVDDIMEEMQDNGYFDSLVNVTLIEQLRSELTTLLNNAITDYTTRLDNFDSHLDNMEIYNVQLKGLVDENDDYSFDNASILNEVFNKYPNGSNITLPVGNKVYKMSMVNLPKNTTINLNGNTLKAMDNSINYNHVLQFNNSHNCKIYNGKIDGNRANIPKTYFHYGLYIIGCENVELENLEIVNCDGEGIFIGYTDYITKNIRCKNIKLSGNLRNDIAITHAENVFLENIDINSIAENSASIDIEIQSDRDIIKNVHLTNVNIKSNIQPFKILKNGFNGIIDNVIINNITFLGEKTLMASECTNLKINGLTSKNGIQFIGINGLDIQNINIKNSAENGIYLYRSSNNVITQNVKMMNVKVNGCAKYGIIIQDVENLNGYMVECNDNKNGIGIFYTCSNINITDLCCKGNDYGIEIQGTPTNVNLLNYNLDGNTNDEFNGNYRNFNLINRNGLSILSKTNGYNAKFTVDDTTGVLKCSTDIGSNKFTILRQYDHSTDYIPNGNIFEGVDGKLRYKNTNGDITTLSN